MVGFLGDRKPCWGGEAREVSWHCKTFVTSSLFSAGGQEDLCHPYLMQPTCSSPALFQWFGLDRGDPEMVQTCRQDPRATPPSVPF